MNPSARGRPPAPTIAWPPPLAGRASWSWLLRLPWRRRRIRKILSLLDGRVPPGSVLLDVGGGTGLGADEAARRAPPGTYRRRVVLDPQREMITRIPPRLTEEDGVAGAVADGDQLPFADLSVDVVLSLGVLCCMTDEAIPRAVAEIWRVLRPGGIAVVTVPLRRGDADDPLFQPQGFVRLVALRPGRSLYQRPMQESGSREPRIPA